METRVDDKGKVFTERITKKPVPVRVYTATEKIEGFIHLMPQNRLKDELNQSDTFVVITKAKVFNRSDGTLIETSDYLVVNARHVLIVTPINEPQNCDSQHSGKARLRMAAVDENDNVVIIKGAYIDAADFLPRER